MEPRGTEASRELVDVLLTLGRLRRTGILTVQGNQQIVGLTFLDGQIVGTDALNESLEEGLGAVLASRNLVSAEDFASMVAEYDSGGGRVTDLLIERSYVDREQLLDAQRWHCYLLCRQVLSWKDSEYKFYAGSEVAHEDGIRGLAVEELLVKAAEDLGPEGPLPGVMPGADAVFLKTDAAGAEVGRDELLIGLATDGDEGATEILERIDGRLSVTDLASDVGLSEYEARLTFYLLERAGRVRLTDAGTGELASRARHKTASKMAGAGASVAQFGARWFKKGKASSAGVKRPRASEIEWNAWPARALGIGVFLLLIALAMTDHGRFLLPFPWQEGLRQGVLDEQTSAVYLKIDRGAKTSFLLNGHFPERLEELVADSYLTQRDLVDPTGRRLGYASQVAGYLIYPEDDAEAAPGAARTEAVSGNFLLDPEFVPEQAVEQPPLVLLD